MAKLEVMAKARPIHLYAWVSAIYFWPEKLRVCGRTARGVDRLVVKHHVSSKRNGNKNAGLRGRFLHQLEHRVIKSNRKHV